MPRIKVMYDKGEEYMQLLMRYRDLVLPLASLAAWW